MYLEALSKQFCSVFTKDTPETADLRMEGPSYPPIPDLKIKTEGIVKLMTGLNPSKAAGPDEIPARLLKNLATELAPVVTSIFSKAFDTVPPRQLFGNWNCTVSRPGSDMDFVIFALQETMCGGRRSTLN